MHLSSILSVFVAAGSLVTAAPFPLPDGFPSPTPQQLLQIEALAGGTLPNGGLPAKLQPAAVTTLQLITLNEIFEVAYFTSLLQNITSNAPGYELSGYNRTYVIDVITAIKNQEELHAIGANGILANAGQATIAPCLYSFPVSDFKSAIALADTFTSVVLGVLPQAQTVFAGDGGDETPLVNLLGSIISQEGEQTGWFRSVEGKVPSAAPFLTTEGPAFAFTFLQGVIVPGSCPGVKVVAQSVPTFGKLNVIGKPLAKNTTVEYSVPGNITAGTTSLVYISGQNVPVTVPISSVVSIAGSSHFNASFPFDLGFAKGLTIAAVVKGTGVKFTSLSQVADATLFGPGVIEVD